MVVISKKNPADAPESSAPQQEWDNPRDPENAADERDEEQLARQKKEAERRRENLSDDEINEQI